MLAELEEIRSNFDLLDEIVVKFGGILIKFDSIFRSMMKTGYIRLNSVMV